MLHGHERAITQIKYNREGDILFSASKDHKPNIWYSLNGERLGTFNGHAGAVWCIDVNWDTTRCITGAGDNSCKLWDCQTGKEIGSITTNSAVRTTNFSYSANMAAYSTDKAMKFPCELNVIDTRNVDTFGEGEPILKFQIDKAKITSMIWGALDESLITGHENGAITKWDLRVSLIL